MDDKISLKCGESSTEAVLRENTEESQPVHKAAPALY